MLQAVVCRQGGFAAESLGGECMKRPSILTSPLWSILWKYHAAAPVVAGVTPTAGGVVFSGERSFAK